ncbi:hypothetical protein GA0116948_11152 [Chitinophaga costaii]|uniref:VOC domain-containing protein n=1 Tax=Chitinophaga costaii TaxID=1335309 RepID=A0A1C4F2E5_9BACT|nr:VOC family protein [Chitinophaga costaii]PUZ22129.1 bleomycin resistance protein [Chitinophaga costaii]SCC49986.1 hypothetical protein GA0116948_11152 [Chitinophaga costaii]
METTLGRAVILVTDYDAAFAFYEKNFFCHKLFESTTPEGKRFLHVGFSEDDAVGIWFMEASTEEQQASVGKQTAGQPTLVIYTDDAAGMYAHVKANDVQLIGNLAGRETPFFHCLDLYGNRLVVVQF